jgi:hypothetical protein
MSISNCVKCHTRDNLVTYDFTTLLGESFSLFFCDSCFQKTIRELKKKGISYKLAFDAKMGEQIKRFYRARKIVDG